MVGKQTTPEQVFDRLTVIGRDRVKLQGELKTNGKDMNSTIRLGFKVGLTAAKIVEALEKGANKHVIGPARVFQIRDDEDD